MENHAVLRYEVLDTGRTLGLLIEPTYTQISHDRRMSFSSTDPGKRGSAPMRELMSAGFEVDIDPETGAVKRFANRNEDLWQTVMEDGADLVLKSLKDEMGTPGLSQSAIPLTEGKQIMLSDFRGADKLQLTVDRVTDEEVVTTLEAQGENIRLLGTMVLERDSGWLKRLALVSEAIEQGKSTVHQKLVMLPEGSLSSLGDWLLDMDLGGEEGLEFGSESAPEAVVDTATAEQVVPSPVGSFSIFDDQLELRLAHGFPEGTLPGRFDLEDLQLQDGAGNPLPLEFFRLSRYTFFNSVVGNYYTQGNFIPLGWDDRGEEMQKLSQVTATGRYHPAKAEALTLPLDADKTTEVAFRGARAEAIPTENPGEFQLRFHHTEEHRFSHRVDGLAGARGYQPAGEWISVEEREILRLVALGRYAMGDTRVVFDGEVPDALTLHLLSDADTAPFSYKLRFVTEAAMRNDLSLPPPGEVFLYGDKDSGGAAEVKLGELELPQPHHNRLSLELPASLAEACKPAVVEAPKINDHPLVWRKQATDGVGDNRLRTPQHWEISTDDGVRQYFYDIRIESAIRCRGQGKWQAVFISLGDRPWLVDPAQLPGKIDPEQPIADFLRRYRFIGKKGRALAPVPPISEVSLDSSTVGDYLTQDRRLRLAGEVQRVEQLVFTGEPEERQWSVSFEPLP